MRDYAWHENWELQNNEQGNIVLEFIASGSNDIHVGLAQWLGMPMWYEIVIGGWANTQSVVRRVSAYTPMDGNIRNQICSSPKGFTGDGKPHRFTVEINPSTKTIVAKQEDTVIISCVDPNYIAVTHYSFSQWDHRVDYCVWHKEMAVPCEKYRETRQRAYTFGTSWVLGGQSGLRTLNFYASGHNDIHVGLASKVDAVPWYEIVIGGWVNTQSVVRRVSAYTPMDGNIRNQICSSPKGFTGDGHSHYYNVEINVSSKTITVKEGENVIISCKDPNLIDVNLFSFSEWDNRVDYCIPSQK